MGFNTTTNVLERIPAGVIHGATALNIIGYNGATTTTYETLWDESSAYTFLTAAMSTPYIASSSANDASAGTGARTVRVTLVNTSFVQSTEDLTLNGQTSVNLATANVLSIQKIEVLTAGSGLANAGVIRIGTGVNTAGVPATVHGHVPVGTNISRHGFYVVPASYSLLVCGLYISSGSATAGSVTGCIKQAVDLTGLVKESFVQNGATTDKIAEELRVPLFYPEKSKLNFQVLSSAGTGPATLLANCILLDRQNTTDATSFSKWI